MEGIRTDEALSEFLSASRPGTAVVEYGMSWCHKCHEIFPTFYQLSKQVRSDERAHTPPHQLPLPPTHCSRPCPPHAPQFPQHRYAVAQVEGMPGAVKHLRYTPTFAIYREGRKVDEVVGNEPQRLADHLWLWA